MSIPGTTRAALLRAGLSRPVPPVAPGTAKPELIRHFFFGPFAPANAQSGRLSTILPSVGVQVGTALDLSPNQIAFTVDEDPWPMIGDRFVYIQLGPQVAMQDQFAGAGRWLMGIRGEFSFYVFLRSARDIAFQDTSKTLAFYDLCHEVVDKMQGFFPTDLAGNILVEEPIRMLATRQPTTYSRNKEWIRGKIPFEIKYPMKLDTSVL